MKHNLLRTKIVFTQGKQYCSKIVFDNLEQRINDLGYRVRRAEARESGQGTALATRSMIRSAPCSDIDNGWDLPVAVQLIPHQNRHYNTKIVLVGLQESLAVQGVEVESCETRECGLDTAIAIRAKLSRMHLQ